MRNKITKILPENKSDPRSFFTEKDKNDIKENMLMMRVLNNFQLCGKLYMNPLFFILNTRKELFTAEEKDFHKINALTCCAIIIFFSFVESVALSVKDSLSKALKLNMITLNSVKQNALVSKDEKALTFEDMMKLTFSILPSVLGEKNHYGAIKNNELNILFTLREIRNNINHPKKPEDILLSLKELNGKDINTPMVNYTQALRNIITICEKKMKSMKEK